MTPEFLEYELRRLPDVVSVAVDDSAVTLLVSPSADADAIRVSVAAMLAAAAVELDVKVLGGVSAATVTRMRVAPIAVGSAAGIGLLATAAAVAALTGAIHLGNPQVRQPTAAARPPATAAPQPGGPASPFPSVVVPGSPVIPASRSQAEAQSPSLTLPGPSPALSGGRTRALRPGLVSPPAAPALPAPAVQEPTIDIPVLVERPPSAVPTPPPATIPTPPNDYVGVPAPEIPAPSEPMPLVLTPLVAPLTGRPAVAPTPVPAPPTELVAASVTDFHPCPPGLAIGLRAHRSLPDACGPELPAADRPRKHGHSR